MTMTTIVIIITVIVLKKPVRQLWVGNFSRGSFGSLARDNGDGFVELKETINHFYS